MPKKLGIYTFRCESVSTENGDTTYSWWARHKGGKRCLLRKVLQAIVANEVAEVASVVADFSANPIGRARLAHAHICLLTSLSDTSQVPDRAHKRNKLES